MIVKDAGCHVMVCAGLVDSSGLLFYYTSTLRPHDAGIMELGLEYTDKMALPPGLPLWKLVGYCIPECTSVVSDRPIRRCVFSFRQPSPQLEIDSRSGGDGVQGRWGH